jgi:hypothetical protein
LVNSDHQFYHEATFNPIRYCELVGAERTS